jgi:hypothetical protein
MQVLVALAQAQGGVVTRDELIDQCWDGRIVSENAINRVISRLRQTAADFAGGSLEIETITKVGYRLRIANQPVITQRMTGETGQPPAVSPPDSATRRTWLLLGGAAALSAVGIGGMHLWSGRTSTKPEALTIFQKAQAIREGGSDVAEEQVIALLREATRIDPDYAEAWGALALAYAGAANWETRPDQAAVSLRSRAAASRALELDPLNPDARLASLQLVRHYRRWQLVERALRAIAADHPEHRPTRGNLGGILGDVGRLQESVEWLRPLAAADQFNPLVRYRFIYALWSAGWIEEAEAALNSAWTRWPKHGAIWQARVKFLAHTGRPSAALALIQDVSARPINYQPDLRDDLAVIRALQSRTADDVNRAVEALLAFQHPMDAPNAMQYCAALGRVETAFELAHGHYLGRGPWAHTMPSENGLTSPGTSLLFNPLTASMRAEQRFPLLMQEIGLADYWRRTRRLPDYLRHG